MTKSNSNCILFLESVVQQVVEAMKEEGDGYIFGESGISESYLSVEDDPSYKL